MHMMFTTFAKPHIWSSDLFDLLLTWPGYCFWHFSRPWYWLHSFSKSDKSRSIRAKCSTFSIKSDMLRQIWENLT